MESLVRSYHYELWKAASVVTVVGVSLPQESYLYDQGRETMQTNLGTNTIESYYLCIFVEHTSPTSCMGGERAT